MASKDVVVNVDEDHGSVSPDQLQFHDMPHSGSDLDMKAQTHTFSNFPSHGDSDDEEDKSQLLKEDNKKSSFWTFEYYQAFFDVDSKQVLTRIVGSMAPNPKSNFLQTQIRPNPDLYGPFWICTTLVFTTAIAGNLANYISLAGKDYAWVYDFQKVTFAGTAVFVYWWLMPSLLYVLLWWRGSQAGVTFTEILCVYGYSLAIYVPISVLWAIPVEALKWILVVVGALLSGSVLVLTFWPAVREDNKKVSAAVVAVIMLFHALLAAGFVLYFFHVPSVPQSAVMPPIQNQTAAPMENISSPSNLNLSPDKQIQAGVKQGEVKLPIPGSQLIGGSVHTPITGSQQIGDSVKSPIPGSQLIGDQQTGDSVKSPITGSQLIGDSVQTPTTGSQRKGDSVESPITGSQRTGDAEESPAKAQIVNGQKNTELNNDMATPQRNASKPNDSDSQPTNGSKGNISESKQKESTDKIQPSNSQGRSYEDATAIKSQKQNKNTQRKSKVKQRSVDKQASKSL